MVINIKELPLKTPCLVYDQGSLIESINTTCDIASNIDCKVLYSIKACAIQTVIDTISHKVNGLSCSSLFEAKLSKEIVSDNNTIHFTSPGLRKDEIHDIFVLSDYVTFNSFSQWENSRKFIKNDGDYGLRINTKLSFVSDHRYDPCRKHSKLGVPIEQIIEIIETVPERLNGLTGLHFHTNCDSNNFRELLETVHHLDDRLATVLNRMQWINLGGGYIFDEAQNIDAFYDAVNLLKDKYNLEVFIEPGASVVRKAGYIVSTVIDLIVNDGKAIAILDTTVNHMPEVFEYQYEPDVLDHDDNGKFSYILAGSSCLAGDKFGEYSFNEPLEIGSKVIFTNAGAYTMTKANYFNGINLPTIYTLTKYGKLIMKKEYTYSDYANHCGVNNNVYN